MPLFFYSGDDLNNLLYFFSGLYNLEFTHLQCISPTINNTLKDPTLGKQSLHILFSIKYWPFFTASGFCLSIYLSCTKYIKGTACHSLSSYVYLQQVK